MKICEGHESVPAQSSQQLLCESPNQQYLMMGLQQTNNKQPTTETTSYKRNKLGMFCCHLSSA